VFSRLLLLLTLVVALVGLLRPAAAAAGSVDEPPGVSLSSENDSDVSAEATLPAPPAGLYVPAPRYLPAAAPLASHGRRHAVRLFRPPRLAPPN
jgi:hypothetical protein